MNRQRPVNLDLATLKYPPTAITSILHRISGVVIFLGLPFLLYLFGLSLESTSTFVSMQELLSKPHLKFVLWVIDSAFAYHLLAGVRHVILDCGIGEDIDTAKKSAVILMLVAGVVVLFLGIWLW